MGSMGPYLSNKIKEYQRKLGLFGRCELCGHEKPINQDHDHANGLRRGPLCFHCNVGLGFFQDDERKLYEAIEYLKRWRVFHAGLTSEGKKKWKYKPRYHKKKSLRDALLRNS